MFIVNPNKTHGGVILPQVSIFDAILCTVQDNGQIDDNG